MLRQSSEIRQLQNCRLPDIRSCQIET
jgi:hypothetical protein